MLTDKWREKLEKRQYRVVGNHSAVSTCNWMKKCLKCEGACYKQQFYGIESHRCLQMTPALNCNHRCLHCWRDTSHFSTDWEGKVDSPEKIVEGSIQKHRDLIAGFGGNEKVSQKMLEEAMNPNQVAISLTGEPMMYPKISGLIKEFDKRGFSTFLVTNGTFPERIESLEVLPTNLYISLETVDRESYKEFNKPVKKGLWEKLNRSLEIVKELDTRTVCRITAVKNYNMEEVEGFVELLEKGGFDFVEVKGYMHVGDSMERLKRSSMPEHGEVEEFAQKIAEKSDYKVKDQNYPSRVVLLQK